jgi:hypothetical protein
MKKNIFIAFLILLTVKAMSQENIGILSGGWASANIEDSDTKGTGWTIKGSYEFNPQEGMFSHGIAFGYNHLTATKGTGNSQVTNTIGSFPIYYAPKLIFGENKIKVFVKGALGTQFASLKREGPALTLTDNDFGFYGGGGGGLMFFIKDNIFLNGEYEIAWASNNWYKDGWISTATIGLGFRF